MAHRLPITEEQLDALRLEAAQKGRVEVRGVVPTSSPFPASAPATSYHGNPVLKPPTWTWQVPLYFFVGGVAGISAVMALVAHLIVNTGLTRAASWVGFAGGLISAPLLIADLGRPTRFLNMLRVFKPRSAMSLGAWTLTGFSSAIGLAVLCQELSLAGYGNTFSVVVWWLAQVSAALSGLILASYTSVLLGVTAIPVWSENRKLVPAVFLTGALGSTAAVLELLGFTIPATQFIGIVASTVEIVIAIVIEVRNRYVDRPLRQGVVGWLTRGGALLAGPISLIIRLVWGHTPEFRYIAALCFVAGALIARYAWITAGRVSSSDPQALFGIQRGGRQGGFLSGARSANKEDGV
jgi:formate-dependent nitrite reductase membrane component NrfD